MNEEQTERIKSLLTKSLLSELHESERSELDSWRELSDQNEAFYKRLHDREYLKSRYKDYKKVTSEKPRLLFNPIFRRVAAILIAGLVIAIFAYQLIIEIKEQRLLEGDTQFEDVTLIVDGSRRINLNSVENNADVERMFVKIDENTIKYYPQNNKKAAEHRIVVPVIKLFRIILPDESVVWLNSKSSLAYCTDFKSTSRRVALEGEGFFDISKDSARPFTVHTDGMIVNVTGTQFNVKAYKENANVEATLVEGKINIGFINREGKSDEYNLKQGEQSVYNKDERGIEVNNVNTAMYTSWKEGVYFFDRKRLEDIMKDLGIWYGLEVIYLNNSVKDRVLSGKLSREDTPEELLATFARMVPGHIKINGRTVTIY